MCNFALKLCILIVLLIQASAYDGGNYLKNEDLVRRFFSYFRNGDPRGIPILDIEDPHQLSFNLTGPRIAVTNASIYGHSQLVIENGYIDVVKLEGKATVSVPVLTMTGIFEYAALIASNQGELNTTLTDVFAAINVSMVIEDGVIQVKDIMQDISKDEIFLDLTNLTWLQQMLYDSGIIQMFFHPIAEIAFNQNKVIILSEINDMLQKFSNTLPPIVSLPHSNKYYDQILAVPPSRINLVLFVARVLHYADFDPVRPPDKTKSIIGIKVKLTDIEVSGLSSVTDIKALAIFYQNKNIILKLSMVFPHILVRYNVSFSQFFLTLKSRPRKINLHNLETNVTVVIDPSQVNSIQRINFNGKADWIGNINRYNSASPFRKFLNRIEKFMQTHFLSIFIKIVQPVIEGKLKEKNLEEAVLSFIRKM